MQKCFAYMYLCNVYNAYRGQKESADSLELELQMIVSYPVGAGVKPRSLGEAVSTLNHLSHIS